MKKIYSLIAFLFLTLSIKVNAQFVSQNISLYNNWSDPNVVAEPVYSIKYNGIWGWAGGGHEYAIIGSTAGTYFIDVTNPTAPVLADYVAGARSGCIWREIKTYSHYAYLVSDDSPPNSFQIVDLQYLPDSVHVVADYNTLFERSHTIFVDGNKLYSGLTRGGLFNPQSGMTVFSLTNPENPTLLRSIDDDFPGLIGYAHDMFVRNDTIYASCGFNGLYIFKYDSLANQFFLINSLTTYPDQGYNHSSALTDDGQTLVFMDEVPTGLAVKVLDVSDLQNLTVMSTFKSNVGPTPHNPFIIGNTCYIAYYQDGLQVYDVSNPSSPVNVGYFDTHNQTPLGGPYPSPSYQGAWGAYPFLPSGNVLVSDMQNGLFVLDASTIQSIQQNQKNDDFVLFPNPSNGNEIVRIKSQILNGQICSISILDATGRVIRTQEDRSVGFVDLKTSGISKGLYWVVLSTADRKICKKLVIQE